MSKTEIIQAVIYTLSIKKWKKHCNNGADKNPHWISVVDDLPPIQDKGTYSDLVLVCGTRGEIDTATYSYLSSRWQCSSVLLTVTHWMPLPAPPMKGGKK